MTGTLQQAGTPPFCCRPRQPTLPGHPCVQYPALNSAAFRAGEQLNYMNAKVEAPSSARYSIQESANGIRASIPAPNSRLAVVLLCVWLLIWGITEVLVIQKIGLPTGPLPAFFAATQPLSAAAVAFFTAWLIGWTVGGFFAVGRLLWLLFGSEVIGIEAGNLIHRFEVFGLGRTHAFAAQQIARLREVVVDRASAPLGRRAGSIAFDYRARTHRIGQALEEEEATSLIEQLKGRLPAGAVAAPLSDTLGPA